MPWSEADRAKYDVIRERFGVGIRVDFSVASGAQETRTQADMRARDIERAVLFDPCGLSLAAASQRLSAVHDGAEPVLCLARQRIMDPDRVRPGDGRT